MKVVLAIAGLLVAGPWSAWGQSRPRPVARDSAETERIENWFAVRSSGVWSLDGEYKGPTGQYSKATGYFAYVGSTTTSDDDGDRAVLALYTEPMAGGAASWLSARLSCIMQVGQQRVRCYAVEGAKQLLDINLTFRELPVRGQRVEAELSEPDNKEDTSKRFEGRSSPRGRLTLLP